MRPLFKRPERCRGQGERWSWTNKQQENLLRLWYDTRIPTWIVLAMMGRSYNSCSSFLHRNGFPCGRNSKTARCQSTDG